MQQPEDARSEFYFTVPGCPVAVREVTASGGASHIHDLTSTPHRHDFAELVLISRGAGGQSVNGVEKRVAAGDVFLFRGGHVHFFSDHRELELTNVMFLPEKLPLPLEWLRRMRGFTAIFESGAPEERTPEAPQLKLTPPDLKRALEIIAGLREELKEQRTGCELGAFCRLLDLIVFLSRCFDAPPRNDTISSQRAGRIVALMEKDFARPWTLAKLAAAAAAAPNTFMRDFRTATGVSPMAMLNRIRMRNAAAMLEKSALQVGEIAEHCGFADSNYFTRRFRQFHGFSPREFRRGAKTTQ